MSRSFTINPKDAIRLVQGFVDEGNLKPVAREIALGGTISKDSIFGSQEANAAKNNASGQRYNGVMQWFCWDDAKPTNFYLAFERHNAYPTDRRVEFSYMQTLMRPTNTFTYPDGKDVGTFLRTHQIPVSEYHDVSISREDVSLRSENFLSKFPKQPDGKLYNHFPYSFFETEETLDVRRFLDQGIEYIRYYFGYDTDSGYDNSNHLRVILVGVDASGKNVFNDNAGVWMLQHSWPPPPY